MSSLLRRIRDWLPKLPKKQGLAVPIPEPAKAPLSEIRHARRGGPSRYIRRHAEQAQGTTRRARKAKARIMRELHRRFGL